MSRAITDFSQDMHEASSLCSFSKGISFLFMSSIKLQKIDRFLSLHHSAIILMEDLFQLMVYSAIYIWVVKKFQAMTSNKYII